MSIKSFFAGKVAKIIAASLGILLVVSAAVYLISKNKAAGKAAFNPAFKAYITAYTGGMISKESPIQISFVSDVVPPEKVNTAADESIFDFDPDIKGTVRWTSRSSIQFTPDQPLPSGQKYSARFRIGEVMEMPEDLKVFEFNFETIALSPLK
jgi:alpha-2-macroglobulin